MKVCNKYLLSTLLAWLLLPAMAQEKSALTATSKGWYAGVEGGVPFGVSTFSSFGADKTRVGFSAGLYGGYRFNPILSLEAFAKWGKNHLSTQTCCAEQGYWLGVDGTRYNASVLNMEGWDYTNLKSSAFMQRYGLQLNVNILGFFDKTKEGRWTLELSPLLAAVGSKATLKTISDNAEVQQGDTRWHLGVGGNLQVGYQVAKHVNLALYSGVTYLTGDRMDGAPVSRHKANYEWESGLKVGFTFGKKAKKATPVVLPVVPEPVQEPEPEVTVCPEPVDADTIVVVPEPKAVDTVVATPEPESLPSIYFAFNSTRLRYSDLPKIEQIRDRMKENPQMKIKITGWCDAHGSRQVNARISRRRANIVKTCLVNYGIEAHRITIEGKGSDFNEPDNAKARRADCVELKVKED